MDAYNKIPKSRYNKLKLDYLKNPKNAYSLYTELNKTYPMDKKIFIRLLDEIRMEKGANAFNPIKKTSMNNPISYYDKCPNSYIEYSK